MFTEESYAYTHQRKQWRSLCIFLCFFKKTQFQISVCLCICHCPNLFGVWAQIVNSENSKVRIYQQIYPKRSSWIWTACLRQEDTCIHSHTPSSPPWPKASVLCTVLRSLLFLLSSNPGGHSKSGHKQHPHFYTIKHLIRCLLTDARSAPNLALWRSRDKRLEVGLLSPR